jgi:hypothetical protein
MSRISHNQIGALVCRYTYDGLGRLIVKETPVQVGESYLQRKDFYYDGVRHIQEHIYRPDLIEPKQQLLESPPDSVGDV